jgi:transcriptional regulator with XRE-family HTH domain
MEFLNNIKQCRLEARKTQKQCADYLGVTQKGYAWYETADRIYYDVLARLSPFFNVSIDHLIITK